MVYNKCNHKRYKISCVPHKNENPGSTSSRIFLLGYLSDLLCLCSHLLNWSPTNLANTDITKDIRYFIVSTSFLAERADNIFIISFFTLNVKISRWRIKKHQKTLPELFPKEFLKSLKIVINNIHIHLSIHQLCSILL